MSKTEHMKQLLDHFSRLGSIYNLNFSGLEILKDAIMGFDGIKRKLLVLSGIKKGSFQEYVIDLGDVKTCSIKKYYGRIDANGLRHKRLEQYLEKMVIHFAFYSKKQDAEILFYKPADDTIHELPQLEKKAQKWKTLFSKLLISYLNGGNSKTTFDVQNAAALHAELKKASRR